MDLGSAVGLGFFFFVFHIVPKTLFFRFFLLSLDFFFVFHSSILQSYLLVRIQKNMAIPAKQR